MSNVRSLKQKLLGISRLWKERKYDSALAEVELLLEEWPGNSHLHILWASLTQLQENPEHSLEEARYALERAVDLDRSAPAGPIELGHFLDAVEDNPQAAAKSYSEGADVARQLLIEALIGQAKTLLQLGKRGQARKCLAEAISLMDGKRVTKRTRSDLNSRFAGDLEELSNELSVSRSASS